MELRHLCRSFYSDLFLKNLIFKSFKDLFSLKRDTVEMYINMQMFGTEVYWFNLEWSAVHFDFHLDNVSSNYLYFVMAVHVCKELQWIKFDNL